MSGGGIGTQTHAEDRQVVIFTFSGELRHEDVVAWNNAVKNLQERFGSRLTGVTLAGAKNRPTT